jgi:DNA-binding HxlR family transcriptional regulator
VDGYGQYCPIALGAEIFAERWTPIILGNLLVGSDRFGDLLAGTPGIPRSVLTRRLRRLEHEGLVERTAGRTPTYRLTDCGLDLAQVCLALGSWGARWRETQPEHHDPYLALWTLTHLIDRSTLPRPRLVVRFEVVDGRGPQRFGPTGMITSLVQRWPGLAASCTKPVIMAWERPRAPVRRARRAPPTRCSRRASAWCRARPRPAPPPGTRSGA